MVRTIEINGTFSGNLTAPTDVLGEIVRFLNGTNATLYAFEVKVIGDSLNASITDYVLKLAPPFIPKGFNITINARPLNGTVFIPYAQGIPVSIETRRFNTTSYLEVHPQRVLKTSGTWDEKILDTLNGSTILTIGGFKLVLNVSSPGNYTFIILHNDTEISISALEVGG